MKAALMPHGRYYKITLTRTEAHILAEYSTAYSDLLTALRIWSDSKEITLYGSKARIEADLRAAEPECPDDD